MRFSIWNYRRIFAVIGAVIMVLVIALSLVNLIEKNLFYPLKFKTEVFAAAKENGVDSALIFAVIKVESEFDESAVSGKGAYGLMQITKSTADYIAKFKGVESFDILDAKTNIDFGVFYLKYLIDKFNNTETAIFAYNAGEGKVKAWLKNKEYSDDGVYLKVVPYRETLEYGKKIKKTFSKYKKLYRNILDK